MKKILIGALVIVFALSVFMCATPQNKETRKDYTIKVLAPNEIIMVTDNRKWSSPNPAPALAEGITEIARDYIIKNAVPITEHHGFGSRTSALLLFVEPRQK